MQSLDWTFIVTWAAILHTEHGLQTLIQGMDCNLPYKKWTANFPAEHELQTTIQNMDCKLQAKGHGPPEMASCGLDGCVRVWDVRQQDQPVASFEPLKGSQVSRLYRMTACIAMLSDCMNLMNEASMPIMPVPA